MGLILFSREFEQEEPANAARAWELASEIAAMYGLTPEEVVLEL